MAHLEFCLQWLWPDLDVQTVSVTEQWTQFAVAGPQSRALLERVLDPGQDVSNDAFPYLACAPVTLMGGVPGGCSACPSRASSPTSSAFRPATATPCRAR